MFFFYCQVHQNISVSLFRLIEAHLLWAILAIITFFNRVVFRTSDIYVIVAV